jgi:hypothetical protein
MQARAARAGIVCTYHSMPRIAELCVGTGLRRKGVSSRAGCSHLVKTVPTWQEMVLSHIRLKDGSLKRHFGLIAYCGMIHKKSS